MTFQYAIIPANIAARVMFIEQPDRPKLRELRAAVGGGYLEHVHAPEKMLHPAMTLFVDEEGMLKDLPYNTRATSIATPHAGLIGTIRLVGDVVAVGLVDDKGHTLPLDEDQLAALHMMDDASAELYRERGR